MKNSTRELDDSGSQKINLAAAVVQLDGSVLILIPDMIDWMTGFQWPVVYTWRAFKKVQGHTTKSSLHLFLTYLRD
jgi:hypothetical protein